MPTLVYDLRPEASALAPEYAALIEAGESVALIAPSWTKFEAPFVDVRSPGELSVAWENETVAVLAAIPAWLAGDDFHRVLVIAGPGDDAAAGALLALGCEAAEIVAAADMQDLAQSWNSGRRLPGRRLTHD